MNPQETSPPTDLCPKRGWVLSVLTDDEDDVAGAALPQGLRFHLLRCPSCREAAERVRRTVEQLSAFSEGDLDPALQDRADYQAFSALRTGAEPRISVASSGSESVDDVLLEDESARRRLWRWPSRAAAIAAMLTFAVFFGEAWRAGEDQRLARRDPAMIEGLLAGPEAPAARATEPEVLAGTIAEPASPAAAGASDVENSVTPVVLPQGDRQPFFGSPKTGHAIHKREE
ncbi:MAG: hypothetical protein BroJett003_24310 [Planctomycetota bacterium]|nr:MAG: hypothetical protein BroJett003_24310 [Planctomycetota bacterium]